MGKGKITIENVLRNVLNVIIFKEPHVIDMNNAAGRFCKTEIIRFMKKLAQFLNVFKSAQKPTHKCSKYVIITNHIKTT